MPTRVVAVIGAIVIIAGLGAWLVAGRRHQATPRPASGPAAATATVKINADGFTPERVAIKQGQAVRWNNADTVAHLVASDPHPSHTDYPGFESQIIPAGGTYLFSFNRVGTWGYHDHLNPSLTGTVVAR